MATEKTSWTLGELGSLLGAEVHGDPAFVIKRPAPADYDEPHGLAFAESEIYLDRAKRSKIGAVIVAPGVELPGKQLLISNNPRLAFAKFLSLAQRELPLPSGIDPTAQIDPTAIVDATAKIGAFTFVGQGSSIGAGSILHPFTYVGDNCEVGPDCVLYPHVVLVQEVVLGQRCTLFPHVVIGSDGFGFYWDGQRRQKIPQVGRVVIGDDVEVGAGTCIDRATSGDTVIERGTKLDNLIQIGHNVKVGEHSVLAALSALAGSSEFGKGVTAGGHVAIKDGTKVADGTFLAGRTGVMQDITEPGQYFGTPAIPLREAMRQIAALAKLPDALKRIKQLEAEIEELKNP